MKKNIFLTGPKQAGKSTLVKRIMADTNYVFDGFLTLPYLVETQRQGFYIQRIGVENEINKYLIAKECSNNRVVPITETFEKVGTRILQQALASQPDIILMDELGFLESDAHGFQKEVFNCLDSIIPVFGVLKEHNCNFLNFIKTRSDVNLFIVNTENRESLYSVIKKEIKGE